MRMCVDYRAVNKQTKKNRYPLPRIDDLFDQLQGATVFSSIDLQSAYHQVRLKPEDIPKTAFTTPFGLFEYTVLCFGLTNAPATFQSVMNDALQGMLGKFVLVYLDDIIVFSKTEEEHLVNLDMVMKELQQHKLFAKLSKCSFAQTELLFLGHIVGRDGVRVEEGFCCEGLACSHKQAASHVFPGLCQLLPQVHHWLCCLGTSAATHC